jgi:hypothetical protein
MADLVLIIQICLSTTVDNIQAIWHIGGNEAPLPNHISGTGNGLINRKNNIKGFVAGRNNMAGGNAPNQQEAARNRAP